MNQALKTFLDERNIWFKSVPHSVAIPAQKVAQVAHISGKQMAKSVIVMVDGEMAMAVLPASKRLDFTDLQRATGAKKIRLAKEYEFRDRFPDCETGAQPPFGNIYDMNVFVSKHLAEDETIYFNAGTHSELIQVSYTDYNNCVHPILADI
jgi:Ala-tRNA(Pro) deacylase